MSKLNITFDATSGGMFPLYFKYPMQSNAQPAYITLDLETGICDADYSSEIGSGVPSDVFHNRVLRFPIAADIPSGHIYNLINDNTEKFQAILDGASIEWDGNNHVGVLTDAAQSLYGDDCGGNYLRSDSEGGMVDDLSSWVDNNEVYPKPGQSIDSLVSSILGCNGDDDYFFSDALNSEEAILAALRDIWANDLYGGEVLPVVVAKDLVNSGVCDDSQWLDELKSFALADTASEQVSQI